MTKTNYIDFCPIQPVKENCNVPRWWSSEGVSSHTVLAPDRPPEGYKRYNPMSRGPVSDVLAQMALCVVRIHGGQKTKRKFFVKVSVGGTHVVNPWPRTTHLGHVRDEKDKGWIEARNNTTRCQNSKCSKFPFTIDDVALRGVEFDWNLEVASHESVGVIAHTDAVR